MTIINIRLNGAEVQIPDDATLTMLADRAFPNTRMCDMRANEMTITWQTKDKRSGTPPFGEMPPLEEGVNIYMTHTGNA